MLTCDLPVLALADILRHPVLCPNGAERVAWPFASRAMETLTAIQMHPDVVR